MEIDKVFNNDVDGVADNLFSAVKNSVSEIKAMQQRKAAENVQLVIQALKKIESDLQDKFDGVTTVIDKRVSTIKDGRDGIDGRNGRDGKDGRPGRDGAPGARGPAGVPGTNGRDGEDGVSVTDAKIDFDGSLIISLSSGREINVGEVVAPDLADKIKVITNGGGTSQGVLDTLASLQAQITAIANLGVVNYVGTWNASTNNPTITSGSGDKGDYYVVSVAGSTNIDGQTLWGVGDWIIFNGTAWQRVDGGSTGNFTTLSASGVVTFDNLTASQAVFTNGSDQLVSNAITGTGSVVMSASPTLTGTISAAGLTTSGTVTHNGGTANGVAYLNGSKVLTTGTALTFDGTNLGLGVTPSAWSSSVASQVGYGAALSSRAAGNTASDMTHGAYWNGTNWLYQYSSVGAARYQMTGANAGSTHAWFVSAGGTAGNAISFTQAMTLDVSGNLLVQSTSSSVTSGVGHKIRPDTAAPFMGTVGSSTSGADVTYSLYSTGAAAYRFYVGYNGTISATTTTISGISDVRLKENIRDLDDGLSAVMALKPRKFDWKAGKGKGIKDDRGFIAQEFEQVFPDLVDEWKDPAPEGEEPYKAVRADLIPVLVKALQELKAEFDAYKATHP